MELLYFVLSIVVLAVIAGVISRNWFEITQLLKGIGVIKGLAFLVCLALSIGLTFVAMKQNNGVVSILLPTALGLVWNALIFTILLDYFNQRSALKNKSSKIAVMNDLIGSTLYYFQTANGIDLDSYQDGNKLIQIKMSTIEKLIAHYDSGEKLSESEISFFPVLGRRLSNHLPIYHSTISSTYTLDSGMARAWTEIILEMGSLSSRLIDFESDLAESIDEFERASVVLGARKKITKYLKLMLAFQKLESLRLGNVT
ncbi:TPA: hypothetical protein I7738_21910 [Vibrio vulnificus]|nr:hypothetical protein [Vibrio vulnificus]EJT1341209.1 hypothetical protein [Vibrio vulnificus]HAS8420749.1 hypothetical protein [Vibrio vulnificus]